METAQVMCVASRPLAACSVVHADQVHPGSFPWCNESNCGRFLINTVLTRGRHAITLIQNGQPA